MPYISRWLLLVSVILQISNLEAILYSGNFFIHPEVKKKDATEKFCVDYRKLTGVTRRDSYPIPHVQDTLDCLHGTSYFSCLDLRSGYWQVEVDDESKAKTAFSPITVYSNSARCPSASLTLLLHFIALCMLFFAVSNMISA